jgi:SAM-dependent methyltransferase
MYPMVGGSEGPASAGLLTKQGRELLDRLAGEEVTPDRAMALSESLRARYPADLVAAALTQQALRAAARAKFSQAAAMLFTRAGLEQASSELTARHSAARFAGVRLVADLCCGIGGNLVALAAAGAPDRAAYGAPDRAASDSSLITDASWQIRRKIIRDHERRVVGVDADPLAAEFARHNVAVCAPGARAAVVCADVTELPLGGFDAIYIDPARREGRPREGRPRDGRPRDGEQRESSQRDGGQRESRQRERGPRTGERRLRAGQSRPPLAWCLRLAGTVGLVCIKAAPGIRRDLVPGGWETEFVAVGRDLKEALLWSPGLATSGVTSRATILPGGHSLTGGAGPPARRGERQRPPVPLAAPGTYLLDPSPAVTRAGLVADLAEMLCAWQIDPMIAFLSSDEAVKTPFARTLRVLESAPWHEKAFASKLRALGIGTADIRRRGLAGDVSVIHRRLGLAGPGAATVVLTRVNDRPWGLICAPLPD